MIYGYFLLTGAYTNHSEVIAKKICILSLPIFSIPLSIPFFFIGEILGVGNSLGVIFVYLVMMSSYFIIFEDGSNILKNYSSKFNFTCDYGPFSIGILILLNTLISSKIALTGWVIAVLALPICFLPIVASGMKGVFKEGMDSKSSVVSITMFMGTGFYVLITPYIIASGAVGTSIAMNLNLHPVIATMINELIGCSLILFSLLYVHRK